MFISSLDIPIELKEFTLRSLKLLAVNDTRRILFEPGTLTFLRYYEQGSNFEKKFLKFIILMNSSNIPAFQILTSHGLKAVPFALWFANLRVYSSILGTPQFSLAQSVSIRCKLLLLIPRKVQTKVYRFFESK